MLSASTRRASDPSLSPRVEQLLTEIANDGFTVYRCGPRDDPTVLLASYEWPAQTDLVTIRDFDRITTARVPKPDGARLDVFAPMTAVWAYHGPADTALPALLDLVHPQHPDAPTTPFPAPRSLHIPRHEQRPMTIRLPQPGQAGVRAARLAAALLRCPWPGIRSTPVRRSATR